MKKKISVLFLFFVCVVAIFAVSDANTFFPARFSKASFPIDDDIGQCVDADSVYEYRFLNNVLREPYSFDWAEQYLHPSTRKNIASLYSALLSDILPSENLLFSEARVGSDKSYVITVKFVDIKRIIAFSVMDNYIYAIVDPEYAN